MEKDLGWWIIGFIIFIKAEVKVEMLFLNDILPIWIFNMLNESISV